MNSALLPAQNPTNLDDQHLYQFRHPPTTLNVYLKFGWFFARNHQHNFKPYFACPLGFGEPIELQKQNFAVIAVQLSDDDDDESW